MAEMRCTKTTTKRTVRYVDDSGYLPDMNNRYLTAAASQLGSSFKDNRKRR